MTKKISKQAQAKIDQGYRKKPNTCSNCTHYTSVVVDKAHEGFGGRYTWQEEKNKSCLLGGFAVMMTATCDKHNLNAKHK